MLAGALSTGEDDLGGLSLSLTAEKARKIWDDHLTSMIVWLI